MASITDIPESTMFTRHEKCAAVDLNPLTAGHFARVESSPDPAPRPVHATARHVLNVLDCGADPTGVADSAPAVRATLARAKALAGPVTIIFPRGSYTLYPEGMERRELYVSNTVGRFPEHRIKNIAVLLEDMDDVIVDGQGSELLFHGRATQFAVVRCRNVTVADFATDWHAPLVLDLTVLASGTADGCGFRDIKVPRGVEYLLHGATATFTGERSPATQLPYWSHGPEVAQEWQNQIRELASGQTWRSPLPLWQDSCGVSALGNGVLRIHYTSTTDPGDAGKVYQLRQRPRDTPAAFIWESDRVELRALSLHYLHGFGIVAQLSRNVTLDGLRLYAKPGSWRQSAGLADFVQLSGVGGKAQITNCLFENPHDDPINIHGTYVQVESIDRPRRTVTLKYMERDTAGFPQFYPGDQLRFVKRSTMLSTEDGDFQVLSVTGPSGRDSLQDLERMVVAVDRELPAELSVGAFVAENMSYTPEVYIAGNTFTSVSTRGILVTTPRPVVIERNHFQHMGMAGIYISADADYWYESSGITHAVIRNNIFDSPSPDHAAIWFDPTNVDVEPDRAVHSNIWIDANRFSLLPGGRVLDAKSVAGLSFTDNLVEHPGPAFPDSAFPDVADHVPVDHQGRLFTFTGCRDVHLAGNELVPSGESEPLQPARWWGVSFGAPVAPRSWLAHAEPGTCQLEVEFAPVHSDTELLVHFNKELVAPNAQGRYVLPLLDGPNVLEVHAAAAGGRERQSHRWVVIAV